LTTNNIQGTNCSIFFFNIRAVGSLSYNTVQFSIFFFLIILLNIINTKYEYEE